MYDQYDHNGTSYEQFQPTSLKQHTQRTFGWMAIGLLITFVTSFVVASTDLIYYIFISEWIPSALLIGKLILVFVLSANLMDLSPSSAKGIFIAYSITTGITFSTLLFIFDVADFYLVFAMTALFFGIMVLIGSVTQKDMSDFTPMVTTGLICLLLFTLLGMFFKTHPFNMAVSLFGLALFLCVTIYDTKRMKELYQANIGNEVMLDKLSIYSALELYLDFVNIFIYLLKITSKRRKR